MKNKKEIRQTGTIIISISLLLISIGLHIMNAYSKQDNYKISYEYVNIKDMAQAHVAMKVDASNIVDTLFKESENNGNVTEIALPLKNNIQEEEMPIIENTLATTNRQIWYLPTQIGRISQNPSYYHAALDITSPRGTGETIFPVANGVISAIYTDNAGAKVISVLHDIDGKKYTSLYAHLSSYANGLYVGKPVTINDSLGQMGSTGYSTGVHLHLVVIDCALFESSDPYCSNLNGFFNYTKQRFSQGYIGLGAQMTVPGAWESR